MRAPSTASRSALWEVPVSGGGGRLAADFYE
jgi:hypothetical protein